MSASDDAGFVERLVVQLKSSKPMLHALVSHHEGAILDGDRLTLTYLAAQKALAEQLQQKALIELLEQQASKLLGRELTVKVEIANAHDETASSPKSPGPAGDEGTESLRAQADRDPLVRRFVDTFQGEIESVRKPDG